MKNVSISTNGKTNTVSAQDLTSAMVPNYQYSVEQVCDLLPEFPKMSVRDALHALVAKGVIWRDGSTSRVKFALLEGQALREAVERKTARMEPPAWMSKNLVGYDASNRLFSELCMTVRK